MTPLAKLALLGGDAVPAIGPVPANSPMILRRWRQSGMDMSQRAQDPPASGWVGYQYRAKAAVRAFEQGTEDLTDKAISRRVRADARRAAAPDGLSGSDWERAKAQLADWLLHRGIGDPAAWCSHGRNEPMESPELNRDPEARSASDPLPATEARKQKDRNRPAIRLMDVWLHEDAAVESDTWELLKSELDRDRLSARRFWT